MSEVHARGCRVAGRRNRLVQETFGAIGLEAEPAARGGAATASDGGSYRESLAGWPVKWRERWGRRANALEDLGLSWKAAEIRAFAEVGQERRATVGEGRARPRAAGRH